MAMFYCFECDRLLDGDWTESFEWDEGNEICIDCHIDATPEDFDDWKLSYDMKPIPSRAHDWELAHKNYDGAPDSGDFRAFTGPSIADVYQQAIEYNEAQDEQKATAN